MSFCICRDHEPRFNESRGFYICHKCGKIKSCEDADCPNPATKTAHIQEAICLIDDANTTWLCDEHWLDFNYGI